MKRLLFGLMALVALGSDKALTGPAEHHGGGDRWQIRLRLFAPEPEVVRGTPDEGMSLAIPTFGRMSGRTEAGGQLTLPVKVVRVAIPEGAEASLESIEADTRLLMGLWPGSSRAGTGVPGVGSGPLAPPASLEPHQEPDPFNWGLGKNGVIAPGIRLGRTGYLRQQKFVEVIYTPVTAMGSGTGSEMAREKYGFAFFPEIEADLVVTGVDWEQVEREANEAGPDAHFEGAYRAGLINYAEGKRFRTRRGSLAQRDRQRFSPGAIDAEAVSTGGGAAMVPPRTSPFAGATTTVYRLIVSADGIYRLDHSYLSGEAPGLVGADPRDFKILNKGVEIPIRVIGEGDGTFDPPDYVEFYGEGLLGEPHLVLNIDLDYISPLLPDIYQANDLTDENVYFLFAEPGTRERVPDLSGTFQGGPPAVISFDETIHREIDDLYAPDAVNDPYVQNPFLGGNSGGFVPDPNAPDCGYVNPGVQGLAEYLGPSSDPNAKLCTACDPMVVDPDPAAAGSMASVRVRLRGASTEAANPDHMTVVQVGTTASDSTSLCWDGQSAIVQSVDLLQSVLVGGAGVFIGQPGLSATTKNETLWLDWVEVDYKRLFRLDGGEIAARFSNADRTYTVTGFPTNVGSDMVVYDVSRAVPGAEPASPRRVTGGTLGGGSGDFSLQFTLLQDGSLDPNDERIFAVAGAGGFRTPDRVEELSGVDLVDTMNEADMIVLTSPDVIGDPSSTVFDNYIAHRSAASGLTIEVAMMQDVYDFFSDGIHTPEAIRSFLAYAYDNWTGPGGTSPPVSYVMLVGDTSVDIKDNTGDADFVNQVPTFIMYQPGPILDFYVSDNYIASFIGNDQMPDAHLGRISIRSPAEVDVVFQKMLDYDTMPPVGSWRSHALILSDRGTSAGEASQFEAIQDALAADYFGPPFSNQKLYYDDPNYGNGTDVIAWRNDYQSLADQGTVMTSYIGHGAFNNWGLDGLLQGVHLNSLMTNDKPTLLVNENCLVAGFHALGGDALGEAFIKKDRKGAIAVFGPSGLSFATVNEAITEALFGPMLGLEKERRFGNLMTGVKMALGFSITDLQAFTLLGDPAQKLTLPAPEPPSLLQATNGENAQVSLSWTASPEPGVLTRIYRRTAFDSNYTLLNPAGAAGTMYVDTTAQNASAYFYRATSLDPNGGFEGTVTNFNSDCNYSDPPMSGPDCVWAIPLNPAPPSIPTGLAASNPGFGNQLNVSWVQSPETDVSKYTVHYGTTDGGPYPMSQEFQGSASGGVLVGLIPDTDYYLVITATNTSSLTSSFSTQASGRPSVFNGIGPPDVIAELEVRRSLSFPDSIELLWQAPTTDIYDNGTSLDSFSIYRDTVPGFVPGPGNLLTVINDPNQGSYTDMGAYDAPQNYYYLVGSTDGSGFSSGIGRQLPQGVADLEIAVNGMNLDLSWSPVTVDIDGGATIVSHYVLYSDQAPVDRASIGMLTPLVPVINGTATSIAVPPGTAVFYSVIVVDVRGNLSPY